MSVREWPGMRSHYAWMAPHEGSVTGAHQVGVSFSQHHKLVYESAGRAVESDLDGGSTIVTGRDPIVWSRVREVTEALEIYPDPALVRQLAAPGDAGAVEPEPAFGVRDGVVVGIASVLRRVHATDGYLSDVAASGLAHQLVTHLLARYCRLPALPRRRWAGRLDPRTVDRVGEFVDASLGARVTLAQLAEVARLSPYHFARSFKHSTGLAPHEFVTSRRMDRARVLLLRTSDPVDQVARSVGFSNLSHFRRTFRRHTGRLPSQLRRRRDQAPPEA